MDLGEQMYKLQGPQSRRRRTGRGVVPAPAPALRGEDGAGTAGHSWQPTLLVKALNRKLRRFKTFPAANGTDDQNAAKLAGLTIERRLIDHAKPRYRKLPKLDLDEASGVAGRSQIESLVYVENLLEGLSNFR